MRITAVYARFFRSLNYDFARASNEGYEPDPWDSTPEGDYPFVRVRLRPDITTIVGGNESGKTQVLRAIQVALTGSGAERSDFCRYSRFFAVSKEITNPEFGVEFSDVSKENLKEFARSTETTIEGADRIAIFRVNATPKHRLYARIDGQWTEPMRVKTPKHLAQAGVPVPFEIDAEIPLPDSVPISYMVDKKPTLALGRDTLRRVWDSLRENKTWFDSETSVKENASRISSALRGIEDPTPEEIKAYELAAKLLLDVAGLDPSLFQELQRSVRSKNGYANSIVDTINSELAKSLDFPHWWSQDSRFELFVSLFEYDLVFMIRDRTGRSYGFNERSDGLKYFLSYFVQYLAHGSVASETEELLLMDEPDRFLSSSGQQDLLRIFEDFAYPGKSDRKPIQVVYVTHSPFLIDKNFADRIRVLEKGEHDEGTRVVASVASNHYEPLRSAFGSFVAETTFIGNCNLMVEGPSDQVLLAGTSRWLGEKGVATRNRLDLNRVTLVPAGGTRHIPYLVYLARGRDVEKPPVIVLLDGDKAGDEARESLREGGAYGNELIASDLVLQLTDQELTNLETSNPMGIAGIEDLVPISVAVTAAKIYCLEFVPQVDISSLHLDRESVFEADNDGTPAQSKPESQRNRGLLRMLELAIQQQTCIPKFHLDKVAFARAVVDVLTDPPESVPNADIEVAQRNFTNLSLALTWRQRAAERNEAVEKISSRINRIKRDFTRTHPSSAKREDVHALIEEIQSQLDSGQESEFVRIELSRWESTFGLSGDPREEVEDYNGLVKAIRSIAYKGMRQSTVSGPANMASQRGNPDLGSKSL